MKLQYFKPSLLTCAAMLGVLALVAPANAKVTIERDGYGVPKITADTDQEMWFAFGFAQARDRLLQLEVLRQEAYGELPTHPDPTVNDPRRTRNWRRLHLFPNLKSTLNREWLSLITLGHKDKSLNTLKTKDALSCFSLGIQAFKNYIFGVPYHSLCKVTEENAEGVLKTELGGDAKQEIEFIKGVFKSQNLPKTEWKAVDSLALFHLRVMHEFSLRNTEMKNLQLLNDLVNTQRSPEAAAQLFNSVKWALTPGAKTTIPTIADHKRSATQKSLQYHQELVGSTKLEVDEQPRELNGCNIYNPNGFDKTVNESITLTSTDMDTATFPRNASNWWVISQPDANQMQGASPSTPNSLLYNGPQITALDPSHTYQVALQSSEGFQFGGNAYIGSLNFWQGHNDTMAFGLTAGNNDVADVFCVPVRKEDGRWRYRGGPAFEPVLSEAAAAEFQAVAGQRDNQGFFGKQLDNMYTVGRTGWPVLAIDEADDQINGTAYIMRYNWQGLTANTLHNWLEATQATDFNNWNTHLDGVAANFNLSAAHINGDIGYRLTGALPVKIGMDVTGEDPNQWNYYPNYDPRLPAPMAPEAGWPNDGNRPVVRNFHKLKIEAQTGGFIANWNQKPFVNMPDTDLDFDAYTPYDRVFIIERELEARRTPWTLEDLLAMNGKLQRMDVNYFAYRPFFEVLSKEDLGSTDIQNALVTILNWNGMRGNYQTGDNLGLHKGHILFYYWLEAMNDRFKKTIANGENKLFRSLGRAQMKLKQPKLSKDSESTSTLKLSTETSHNIPLGSRIMLQALHAAFGAAFSEDHNFPAYEYDPFQAKLLTNRAEAFFDMKNALDSALAKANQEWSLNTIAGDYLPSDSATFSGLSQTLAANDTNIGFRPGDPLEVKHFRNRGALNIGAALGESGITARNISSPGIREYRGHDQAPVTPRWGDWTINQLNMFSANAYRPMHPLTPLR